jgi:hypothetical protein
MPAELIFLLIVFIALPLLQQLMEAWRRGQRPRDAGAKPPQRRQEAPQPRTELPPQRYEPVDPFEPARPAPPLPGRDGPPRRRPGPARAERREVPPSPGPRPEPQQPRPLARLPGAPRPRAEPPPEVGTPLVYLGESGPVDVPAPPPRRRTPPPPPPVAQRRRRWDPALLRDRRSVRQAIVLATILGPCRANEPYQAGAAPFDPAR